MSMNLTLHFEDSQGREIRKVGLRQTPTKVTYGILQQVGKEKEAYINWLKKFADDEELDGFTKYIILQFEEIYAEYSSDYKPVWGVV